MTFMIWFQGVILDWLDLMDPSVLANTPDLQALLFFAKQNQKKVCVSVCCK